MREMDGETIGGEGEGVRRTGNRQRRESSVRGFESQDIGAEGGGGSALADERGRDMLMESGSAGSSWSG